VYDAEGRLVAATVRGVRESYTYDAFGNRTAATGASNCLGQSACASSALTISTTTNHVTGMGYDDAGNVNAGLAGEVHTYDGTSSAV
jgi:YD repeat-containing protein